MMIAWRTLLVMGTVYALVMACAAALAWAAGPAVLALVSRADARRRANVVLVWRLVPTALAAVVAAVVGLAFFRFEPAASGERVGVVLLLLAAVGLGSALILVARLIRIGRLTATLGRLWTRGSPALRLPASNTPVWVVDAGFPLAAVIGFWHPKLVMARSIVESCAPRELEAIAAHEHAHIRYRDNFARLGLQAVAGGFESARRADRAILMWQEAVEEAADDAAAASGPEAVDLAEALVTVARLAANQQAAAVPVATCFYRGDGLERRVRRLLAVRPAAAAAVANGTAKSTPWGGVALLALLAGAAAIVASESARTLYIAAELMVQRLP